MKLFVSSSLFFLVYRYFPREIEEAENQLSMRFKVTSFFAKYSYVYNVNNLFEFRGYIHLHFFVKSGKYIISFLFPNTMFRPILVVQYFLWYPTWY